MYNGYFSITGKYPIAFYTRMFKWIFKQGMKMEGEGF